ncbi:uncharacterized protein [Pyxicephalus adspersus]|uniref:uncharacterized protein isoform X2 n=1 Tax=Pyxicephalus adspersus TaxID=30357 RepID=UPI003B5BE338
MEESNAATNTQKIELKKFCTTRNKMYTYGLKTHLAINNVCRTLDVDQLPKQDELQMMTRLRKVRLHQFQHMQVPIPVYKVKHVTERTALYQICKEEGFKTPKRDERPEFNDLSYWSADISLEDIERARQQAYEKVSKVINPSNASKYERELKEQFGNSVAFQKSVSWYGTFQFSFPLQDLLTRYKEQHCNGGMPRLKILGTGLYKLEIAHYVVVHSPDTDKFNDFPEVPTVHGGSDPLPFVYWMDGQLYWRPESTSIALKVMVTEDGQARKECYRLCDFFTRYGECFHTNDGTYSFWNHLILGFHLPGGHLEVPKEQLVKNLTACDPYTVYIGNEKLGREEAEEIILQLKEEVESSEKAEND